MRGSLIVPLENTRRGVQVYLKLLCQLLSWVAERTDSSERGLRAGGTAEGQLSRALQRLLFEGWRLLVQGQGEVSWNSGCRGAEPQMHGKDRTMRLCVGEPS